MNHSLTPLPTTGRGDATTAGTPPGIAIGFAAAVASTAGFPASNPPRFGSISVLICARASGPVR